MAKPVRSLSDAELAKAQEKADVKNTEDSDKTVSLPTTKHEVLI